MSVQIDATNGVSVIDLKICWNLNEAKENFNDYISIELSNLPESSFLSKDLIFN